MDSHPSRIPVAIVLDHPVQHFSPAFRTTEESTLVDPIVLYRSSGGCYFDAGFDQDVTWDVDLTSGYTWWAPRPPSRRIHTTVAVWTELRRRRPKVVLCFGWSSGITKSAMAWSMATRTPFLLYGDSTWQYSGRRWLRPARSLVLRALFSAASGALSTGTFNREFYIRLGIHPSKVHEGVYPADVAYFAHDAGTQKLVAAPFVIGFAGKLIPRKGVDELLRALALLSDRSDWSAVIVGDGVLRPTLEEQARQSGIAKRVKFLGFQNMSLLPALLASCDVVVVPSNRDQRVLVVTEAMAAGAGVVVSSATAVWGKGDLVEDGVSGLVYPSGHPDELAAQLERLIDDPDFALRLRNEGRARAKDQGPDAFRTGLEQAARVHAR